MRQQLVGVRHWHHLVRRVVPWLPQALLAVTVLVPMGLFTWLFFYTDIFTVQAVTVVDAREHTEAAVREIIEQRLTRTPLSRNIFFVQTSMLEVDISALPHVRTVHVQRKLPGTIKAIVQEKTPALLLLSNGHYYFVDAEGVAFEEARLATLPGVLLPTVKNDDAQAKVTLGAAVVAPLFVTFLQTIQQELPQRIGREVAQIRIPSLSAREVHVVLDSNLQVRFDVTRPAERQLEILHQILTTTSGEEDKEKLQYVDLRIDRRVYYRTTDAVGSALPSLSPDRQTLQDTTSR
ncbi:MAG: FtsQ-type POTRA domain-containing protein [Candidatus Andersenbacteria bacterium]|nr:FtsQ-type POTRA domain-containing protein [Candidatus Andersenbacteria bacterium]